MSNSAVKNIRSLLSNYRRVWLFQQQQRYAVTVTDEYRPSTKSRSSLKGVELLRNPALNKVSGIKKSGD